MSGDLIRIASMSLDISDALLDAVVLDDNLLHDLAYEMTAEEIAAAAELRQRMRQHRCLSVAELVVEMRELVVTEQRHEHHVSQVRGVLAERVVLSSNLDPFMSLRALVEYGGFSRRTLLNLIAGADHALPVLPHYRVGGGKIVVRRSDFDSWMQQFRHTQSRMDELVDERRRQRAALRLARQR